VKPPPCANRSMCEPSGAMRSTSPFSLPHQIQPYYTLPSYVNDVPGFAKDVDAVDRADGRKDGKWRNNSIDQLLQGFDTPARIPYQERVLETMITREGFGRDDVPDLLNDFIEVYAAKERVPAPKMTPEALALLQAYAWPGNVRELRNVAERLVVRFSHGESITPDELPAEIRRPRVDATRFSSFRTKGISRSILLSLPRSTATSRYLLNKSHHSLTRTISCRRAMQ